MTRQVLNQDNDIDSGIPQTTFTLSHATVTTNVNKTSVNWKKKIQLQTKAVQKNKHTISTDTSGKQSDTSKTRDQHTKPTKLVTLETAFDKEHMETQYRQRQHDTTQETNSNWHRPRNGEIQEERVQQRPNAKRKNNHSKTTWREDHP